MMNVKIQTMKQCHETQEAVRHYYDKTCEGPVMPHNEATDLLKANIRPCVSAPRRKDGGSRPVRLSKSRNSVPNHIKYGSDSDESEYGDNEMFLLTEGAPRALPVMRDADGDDALKCTSRPDKDGKKGE
eukprot:GEMP01104352.1.p1 GENE.GEMP01104352.1~~GEMP01104352.1.p1  ORF type:complete len:129 (+),score=32.51 GEMP01104352.1:166-552(+)